MNEIQSKLNIYFSIKNIAYASLVLNLACIVLGIIYVAIPIYSITWDIFGIILFVDLFANFLLVYVNSIKLNKTTIFGNRLNLLCYIYPVFVFLGMLFMVLGNLFISITYSNALIDNIGWYTLVYGSNFGIFAFGGIIAYLDVKNLDNREVWDIGIKGDRTQTKRTRTVKVALKIVLAGICFSTLMGGVYLSRLLLFPGYGVSFVFGIIPQFAIAFAFIFLSATFLLIKTISRRNWRKVFHYGFAILGLTLTIILLLPLFFVPYSINLMEGNFASSFGSNWRSNIPAEVESQYFMGSQFSFPEHFLGIAPKDCKIDIDKEFYSGEGIRLHYDAYYLEGGGDDLPGKNSIIIKIHGGSWRYGDKGFANMMQVNKYLVAQGYVVFDIQYGLKETEGGIIPTPDYVLGDFDIEDMIRHIGIFTQNLINNYSKLYNADLSSVFVMGGSAGGHLTCTTALAIASGSYNHIFGSGITIKGMVPIYPANNYSGLPGRDEFQKPENYFITSTTFPCFIFQGMNDLGCALVSQDIKDKYSEAGNDDCAILWLPFAGHANDLYFSGHYNMLFMYYLERFLYLCVNDLI